MEKKRYPLFRGRREMNGEWVFGSLTVVMEDEDAWKIVQYWNDNHSYNFYVEADTVGEYSGKRDKNNKQIFEGDILRSDKWPYSQRNGKTLEKDKYYAVVSWLEDSSSFGLLIHKNPKSSVRGMFAGTSSMSDWNSDDWEVIGNIHDNPKLIQEDKA